VIRILLADDSVVILERITELLRDLEGIELAGRAGGIRETSRLLEQLHPDVVILDLQMPDGNGFEIIESIKESRPEPVVIVLTNSGELPVRERCLKSGADFFLDKSSEFERLPQIVRQISATVPAAPELSVPAGEPATGKIISEGRSDSAVRKYPPPNYKAYPIVG
jgi:DNA-binding NarL/FixJ family response regulator